MIAAVAEGDMLRTQMAIWRRLSKHEPVDTIGMGRQIAKHVIEAGGTRCRGQAPACSSEYRLHDYRSRRNRCKFSGELLDYPRCLVTANSKFDGSPGPKVREFPGRDR